MKNQNVHAVIDLGSGTIKLMAGSIQNKKASVYKIVVKRTSASGFKNGKIHNVEEVAENIKEAINSFNDALHVSIKSVSLSVPPQDMELSISVGTTRINNENKVVNTSAILNAIEACNSQVDEIERKIIYTQPRKFELDGYAVSKSYLDQGAQGSELSVTSEIYTIPKVAFDKYKHTLKKAGLELTSITLSPIAISNELKVDKNISVLLDIGHHKTYMSIFIKGVLLESHTIEWSGKNITHEINKLFDLNSYGFASKIKHKYTQLGRRNSTVIHVDDKGKKWTITDLNQIVGRNMVKILKEAMNILEEKKYLQEKIDLILTGGSANFTNLEAFAKYHTKQMVRVYIPTVIGARKPELTSLLGSLYLTDKYIKQRQLQNLEANSLDVTNWFRQDKPKSRLFQKLKKLMKKKGV